MTDKHPNVAVVERLDLHDLSGAGEVLAEDVVWHFFNPRLPDLQGDYVGADGIRAFFERLGAATGGSFEVEPISIEAIGEELVVAHTRNHLAFSGMPIRIDVVVVWRVVGGRIAEVWDIPSAYSHTATGADPSGPDA